MSKYSPVVLILAAATSACTTAMQPAAMQPAFVGPAAATRVATATSTAAPAVPQAPPASPTPAAAVHWTYEGEEGPAHWGDLAPAFALCKTGQQQTPIDVPATARAQPAGGLTLAYQPSAINLVNNGHTIQVDYDAGSTLAVAGSTYDLAQFHFHAPSEHKLNGKVYAMEAHFVHKAADGKLAVLGVLMAEGDENTFLAPWWGGIPAEKGSATGTGTVNASTALPADRTYVTYPGSLTTPPCSEGITWVLLTTPASVSRAQVETFKHIVGEVTARPVQPVNGRIYARAGGQP